MAGEVVTAALLNTHLRDNLNYLHDSAAFIREGGSTTPGSTTSTAAVDVVTVSGLSIAPNRPITIMVSFRKQTSGGALNSAGCGLKVDGTVISEAINTVNNDTGFGALGQTATAEVAFSQIWVGQRATNYFRTSFGEIITSAPTGAGLLRQALFCAENANWPSATTTAIAIRGRTGSLGCTLFVDQVHIYSLPATSL